MATTDAAVKKTLEEVGVRIVSDIQQRMSESRGALGPMNDTGEASKSLSYKVSGNKLTIEGLARLFFLEFGRRPGAWPNVDAIKKWVRSKLGVTEEEVDSVAYLVGRKIYRDGTEILNDKSKGLRLDLILDMFIEEVGEKVTEGLVKNVILDISQNF